MSNVAPTRRPHPKVSAAGLGGAATTLVFAVLHLLRTGSVGVDEATLAAAIVSVAAFAAGYLKRA